MYSAASSPPRWPVRRPSRRSWERKRTCCSMWSARLLCRAAMAGGGRCDPKCDSGRGFGGFPCADTAAIGNRTAASTAILRMFKRGPRSFSCERIRRIVNGNRRTDRNHRSIAIRASYWGNFGLSLSTPALCPATAGSVFRASTSTEVADVFSGLKDRRKRRLPGGGALAVNVLEVLFDTSYASQFDLAALSVYKH